MNYLKFRNVNCMTERDQLSKSATLHCSLYLAEILVALLTVWAACSDTHQHASNVYFIYNSSYTDGLGRALSFPK